MPTDPEEKTLSKTPGAAVVSRILLLPLLALCLADESRGLVVGVMPSSVACRSLRTFIMGGFECFPVRCSALAPAPAPFLPHHLLRLCVHLCSAPPRRPGPKNLPFCQKSSGFCSYSYDTRVPRNAVALPAVHPEVDKKKKIHYLKSKLEEQGIRCGDGKPGSVKEEVPGRGAYLYSSVLAEGWRIGYVLELHVDGEPFEECKIGYAEIGQKDYRLITEIDLQLEPLCKELIEYFAERLISAKTLERNGIMQCNRNNQIVIAFSYRRNAALVSCKYRASSKKCWQETGTERIFYGLDDIKQASDVIIVEGEIDKLSMEEVGFPNCISVPYGLKELPAEDKGKEFQYLWNCKEYLEKASRIILATDADGPGQALAEELARRLGKERCWRVKWPKKNTTELCKGANEVLMYLGAVDQYYHQSLGSELGVSTGWRALDELYNVVPGELTVITGVPNSGKSEWIDALLCNINEACKWKFLLCSMENKVRDHARKLLEKYINKPFFNSRCEDDSLPSIDWVLELAKSAVLRYGIRGLVIDPYNELDHQRSSNQTETEYVSHMLTKIKRFAQHHSCHVWFVAHPRQLQNWLGYAPNLYDISGSAHFINKCDNGIVIHRNRNANAGPLDRVQVCVRKVRNKVAGRIGDAFLSYDQTTGKFEDWRKGAYNKLPLERQDGEQFRSPAPLNHRGPFTVFGRAIVAWSSCSAVKYLAVHPGARSTSQI
ncbi:DnaB-like helicase C terminal domain [Musa troglodytarum]|uniref:DnaB-like helicase C terminal domain n=1 Tax=Musa troglodytarum TaxID=320322 RepID=A0A9E7HA40_9LILI|nr:DnaB-like helicase C terminal domain [Musa troglodytarum]